MQADATGLKGDIRRGLSTVGTAASAASINVAALAELDLAKSRMEAACSTLQVHFIIQCTAVGERYLGLLRTKLLPALLLCILSSTTSQTSALYLAWRQTHC